MILSGDRMQMLTQKQFRVLERVHELIGNAMNIHYRTYPRVIYKGWFWSGELVSKMAQLGHKIEEVWEK